jgi:hypothetical protein
MDYSPEKCGDCGYLVDWHDAPETTGYSMAKQGFGWYGCMRYVATINHPSREHRCRVEEARERQLTMSL